MYCEHCNNNDFWLFVFKYLWLFCCLLYFDVFRFWVIFKCLKLFGLHFSAFFCYVILSFFLPYNLFRVFSIQRDIGEVILCSTGTHSERHIKRNQTKPNEIIWMLFNINFIIVTNMACDYWVFLLNVKLLYVSIWEYHQKYILLRLLLLLMIKILVEVKGKCDDDDAKLMLNVSTYLS